MSDPNLEEDSLISQDDIDKLLDASSIEEAEQKLQSPEPEEAGTDDLGELSQDDIDSLLNGSAADKDEDIGADVGGELSQDDIDSLLGGEDDADEAGELSQDDIDSLMAGAPDEVEAGELSQDDIDSLLNSGPEDGGETDADDEVGELSQDDIDSLLNNGPSLDGEPEPAGEADDEDMELISQDDIDRLMNPMPEDAGKDADADPEEDDELISMDDIQGLLETDPDAEAVDAPPVETDGAGPDLASLDDPGQDRDLVLDEESPGQEEALDQVIDSAEGMAVADCLMTQETMDALIQNARAGEGDDPGGDAFPMPDAEKDLVDLDLEDDASSFEEEIPSLEPEGTVPDADDGLAGILAGDEDDNGLDLDGDDGSDVTQEDIDALLQESDDDQDFMDEDDDILISQDDIDTLLMAADQEDEDVLGDLLGEDSDAGLEEDFGEEDFLDDEDEEPVPDRSDQVVLEGVEAPVAKAPKKPGKLKKLLKSKWVLAAASVLVVIGITVPAAYFLFFSKKVAPLPDNASVPLAAEDLGREIEVASVAVDEESLATDTANPGTMVLADFIILASDLSKELAYVHTDISIDYSDQRAYHEINSNLSFYRDLIYDAIQTSLVSERRDEVTEADLVWGVESTLKKVLPAHYITRISFKNFKTS